METFIVVLSIAFVVFAHALVAFTHTSKKPLSHCRKKTHNARSLQENTARSAANQSARTIVAI